MSGKEPKQTFGAQGKPLRECPYCGCPLDPHRRQRTCTDHDDLPALDPCYPTPKRVRIAP
jgi:hypothetical protein